MKHKYILYTIDCPKCKVLEKKLKTFNITDYEVCKDEDIMRSKGMDTLPMLDIDGTLYTFAEAIKWLNTNKDKLIAKSQEVNEK